jgi:hypothetical protein
MSENKPRVKMIGEDGNAFSILGKVNKALKKAGRPKEGKMFLEEAMQGDCNHLLKTAMKYVTVE